SAAVTLSVVRVHEVPVASDDSYTLSEDQTLSVAAPGVLANDTDGDTPTASLIAVVVSPPAHGSLLLNANGSFRYTPAANYIGPDRFTYIDIDGLHVSNIATVTLSIKAVNDAPVALGGS